MGKRFFWDKRYVLKKMFKAMPTADLKECSLLVFKMVQVNLVEVGSINKLKGFISIESLKSPFIKMFAL